MSSSASSTFLRSISSSPERLFHGSDEHPVEVRADDLILARRRRQHAHALGLATRFLADFLGQLGLSRSS